MDLLGHWMLVTYLSLLETPIRCTLPLANFLRVKPKLWEGVAKCLKKTRIELPNRELPELRKEVAKSKCILVPLNKVEEYYEGEDGNTTLLVEFNECTHEAILDSGAGIAIATKGTCKSWEKPALRKTQ